MRALPCLLHWGVRPGALLSDGDKPNGQASAHHCGPLTVPGGQRLKGTLVPAMGTHLCLQVLEPLSLVWLFGGDCCGSFPIPGDLSGLLELARSLC